jgi:membrane protease YdiL (CAAX protease family)
MDYSNLNSNPSSQSIDGEIFTPNTDNPMRVRNVFLFLGLFFVLGIILTGVITQLLQTAGGWSPDILSGRVTTNSAAADLWKVRFLAGLNQLLVILLPASLTVLALRRQIFSSIGMHRAPDLKNVLWGIVLMIIATPLVLYTYEWNKLVPMPDWMVAVSDQANATIKAILQMPSSTELIGNITLIAIIPAFGEELLFRGLIQRQLMRRMSPWVAIVITGALFSLFHFQMDGFVPRWLLGMLLGWLYWRSGNFWVPVIAHFFNNAIQVVAQYFYAQQLTSVDLEQDVHVPALLALLSATTVFLAMRGWEKRT